MTSVPADVVGEFKDGLERNVALWSDVVRQHVSGLKLDLHDTPRSPHKDHMPKTSGKKQKLDPEKARVYKTAQVTDFREEGSYLVDEDGDIFFNPNHIAHYHVAAALGVDFDSNRELVVDNRLSRVSRHLSALGNLSIETADEGATKKLASEMIATGEDPNQEVRWEQTLESELGDWTGTSTLGDLAGSGGQSEVGRFRARRDLKADVGLVFLGPALYKMEKHLPGEHDQKKHGRKGWTEDLTYSGGKMTLPQKKKIRKRLLKEYGDDEEFRELGRAISLYTQGFFKDIRRVGAAMATDTMEELEANAIGFFGEHLQAGKEDPVMSALIFADVIDIDGEEMEEGVSYLKAQKYAHAIANAIENATPTDDPLYRGSYKQRPIELEVGDTFDIPGSSSFTRSESLGMGFAEGTVKGQKGKTSGYRYVIEIEGPNRAVDVDALSPFHQQEAITNGRFEVVEVEEAKRDGHVGRIKLRQQAVVDADYTADVSYDLPADVGRDLKTKEREAVIYGIKTMDQSLGSGWPVDLKDLVRNYDKDEVDPKNLKTAFERLGYWVGFDPSYSSDIEVVRDTDPNAPKKEIIGDRWDSVNETFYEYQQRTDQPDIKRTTAWNDRVRG